MYEKRIETCSQRISKALSIKGMRPAELCKLAHVPKSSLSLYMSGAYEPKQDRIYDIAKALNVSEAWLMGYDVPMERQNPSGEVRLTEGERQMLELFKLIPEEQQPLVLEMIRAALRTR